MDSNFYQDASNFDRRVIFGRENKMYIYFLPIEGINETRKTTMPKADRK